MANDDKQQHELSPWEQAQLKQKKSAAKSNQPLSAKLPKFKRYHIHALARRMTILITFFSLCILFLWYLVSPIGHVGVISVKGVKSVGEQNVINASGVSSKDNFLTTIFSRNQITKKTQKKLPKLKTLTLSAKGVNNISFTVTEYQTMAYLVRGKKYYQILETGAVIGATNTKPTNDYPIFMNFKDDQYLKRMIKGFKALKPDIMNEISEVKLVKDKVNPNKIHVYMNDGNEVIADMTTFAKKMKYYNTMAADMKSKGVLDIEVGQYSFPFKDDSNEKDE